MGALQSRRKNPGQLYGGLQCPKMTPKQLKTMLLLLETEVYNVVIEILVIFVIPIIHRIKVTHLNMTLIQKSKRQKFFTRVYL